MSQIPLHEEIARLVQRALGELNSRDMRAPLPPAMRARILGAQSDLGVILELLDREYEPGTAPTEAPAGRPPSIREALFGSKRP